MKVTVTRNEAGDFEYRNEAGQLHHDHGAAVVKATGEQYFYQNGVLNEMATNMFNNYLAHELTRDRMEVVSDEHGIHYYKVIRKLEFTGRVQKVLHNDIGAAKINAKGTQFWYNNDIISRQGNAREGNLPAILSGNGEIQIYVSGFQERKHRTNGAAVECADGCFEYFKDGNLYREDGPARKLSDGSVQYFKSWGALHNETGAAWIKADGTEEFWIYNSQVKSLDDRTVIRTIHDVSDAELGSIDFGDMFE